MVAVGDSSMFKTRARKAWQPTHMDLVGSQTRGGADRSAIRKFDIRELFILVGLELVDGHCQHLSDRVVYAFRPTAAVCVVRAGGILPNPEKLMNGK